MKGCINNKMGQIQIDTDVIALYAGTTAVECFGIVGMAAVSMKDGLVKLLKRESLTHGINVTINDNAISIDFHVVPRWMGANDQVRADAGKTALMKGPLVYCLEEKENGRFLSEIFVEENTSIEENAPAEELVGNVPTLSYKGIRVRNKGADGENQLYGSVELEKEEVSLRAVPYCMWNNRGQGEMLVWHKLRI